MAKQRGEDGDEELTFDSTVLVSMQADLEDDELVSELVRRFLADAPGHIDALAAAALEEDSQAVITIAHLIRGSALTFGARRLASLCAQLEASPVGSLSRVDRVAEEFSAVSESLSSYRDGDGQQPAT